MTMVSVSAAMPIIFMGMMTGVTTFFPMSMMVVMAALIFMLLTAPTFFSVLVMVFMTTPTFFSVLVMVLMAAPTFFSVLVMVLMAAPTFFSVLMMVVMTALIFMLLTASTFFSVLMMMVMTALILMPMAAPTLIFVIMMMALPTFPMFMMMPASMPAVVFKEFFYLNAMLQRTADRFPVQFLPWCGNNRRLRIHSAEHMDTFLQLLIRHHLRPADDNCRCVFYLILEKLTEIFKVQCRLLSVNHRNPSMNLNLGLLLHIFDCLHDIR